MRNKLFLIFLLTFIFLMSFSSAAINVQLSDQGSNVKSKSNGQLLSSGSLNVTIYDAASGGV